MTKRNQIRDRETSGQDRAIRDRDWSTGRERANVGRMLESPSAKEHLKFIKELNQRAGGAKR